MIYRLADTRRPTTTANILRTMGEVTRRAAATQTAMTLGRQIAASVRGPEREVGPAVSDWIAEQIRYVHEEPETVVGLEPLLELGAGDCDDMACAVASILATLGWRCLWAVGYDGAEPVHVWTIAEAPDGSVVELDPTIPGPGGTSPIGTTGLTGATVHTLSGRQLAGGGFYA